MSEKKVENIHTKPRGKGQCSPEQTCPEVPLVLYRFLILVDVIFFVSVDKTAERKKKLIQSNLYLPVFVLFLLYFLTLKCLLRLHIGRKSMFVYLSGGCEHTDVRLALNVTNEPFLFCRNSYAMDLLSSFLCLIMPCSVCFFLVGGGRSVTD